MKKILASEKFRTWGAAALILAVGLIVYGLSVRGGFILEDYDFIVHNPLVKSWAHPGRIWTMEVGSGAGRAYTYYRPVHILGYLVQHSLWGLRVEGYHGTSILLHGVIGCLIYAMTFLLFGEKRLSLWTALLFLTHPVHNAAVAHIAGQENLWGALFLLLSFVVYLRTGSRGQPLSDVLMFAVYALALFSKENNIMLPALLVLYHVVFARGTRGRRFVPVAAAAVLYIGVRVFLLNAVPLKPVTLASAWARVPSAFVALTNYLILLLIPSSRHPFYENPSFAFTDPRAVIGMALAAFLLWAAWRVRRTDRVLAFGIGWFLILFIPVSNIYPLNAYLGEHRIYLASIGYFLIVAAALRDFARGCGRERAAYFILFFLLVNQALLTMSAERHWQSQARYVEDNYRVSPDNPLTMNAYACLQLRRNEIPEAIALFQKIIKHYPGYADAYDNLGAALLRAGRHQEAVVILQKALLLRPEDAVAFCNLGNVLKDRNEFSRARALYLQAVRYNPYAKVVFYDLGVVSAELKDYDGAIRYFERAVQLDPDDARAFRNLIRACHKQGRDDLVVRYYRQWKHREPPRPAGEDSGQITKAIDAVMKAEGLR